METININKDMEKAINYCIKELLKGRKDVEKIKKEAAMKYNLNVLPKNSFILPKIPKNRKDIIKLLFRKPTRTLSGVSPLALMIKPQNSCKWNCIYCPISDKAPRSYTGEEPSALRARQNSFHPKKQIEARLTQYHIQGHPTDKLEVIVMGGTFLAMEKSYRRWFIKTIYDTLNEKISRNIGHAKNLNEYSKYRVVGLTIETRPDVCGKKEINEMLYYGATRVELGVQHPDDRIYQITRRGHKVKDVISATRLLKDSSYKVVYHIMLGLPHSSYEKDIQMFKMLFKNPDFRPDMLKIYPTLVHPSTPLYTLMKKGEYQPYTTEEAAEVISEAYRYIPYYVRIMRVQRDIPTNLVEGVKHSNLRELAERKAIEKGIEIKEIRFREAGRKNQKLSNAKLFIESYTASQGKEYFISLESEDRSAIFGFIRIRIPSANNWVYRYELHNAAFIRELHVYGKETPLGKIGEIQHRGVGSRLLKEAESLAKQFYDKIAVISGSGVRQYYRKHGYKKVGAYMVKKI